jgi:hypothetical protein
MNRFLKLVHFEWSRFFKIYLVLIGITILFQNIAIITEAKTYLNRANDLIYKELIPKAQFIEEYGTFSFFEVTNSMWFLGPIALCIAALIIYVFFIWYRDWVGKNTFAYRLLMLPTARMNIYLAKATTILLFVLGLVALQLLLFPVEGLVIQWMVPTEFRSDLSVYEITKLNYLNLFFPSTFLEFVIYYGAGMIAVLTIFNAILFERSFRLKGIFYGILYCAAALFIFLIPILVDAYMIQDYFYPIELFIMEVIVSLLLLAGTLWIGNYLMKNKIRV